MLADILAHLRATLPQDQTPQVEVAEDIDVLDDVAGRLESGAVVIVPWRQRAAENPLATGGFRQRVSVQFMTAIVIRAFDHQMGEERALQFDGHVHRLEQALAGWEPPGGIAPCHLVGGESSPLTKGVSIFVQNWETARFLTGAST